MGLIIFFAHEAKDWPTYRFYGFWVTWAILKSDRIAQLHLQTQHKRRHARPCQSEKPPIFCGRRLSCVFDDTLHQSSQTRGLQMFLWPKVTAEVTPL